MHIGFSKKRFKKKLKENNPFEFWVTNIISYLMDVLNVQNIKINTFVTFYEVHIIDEKLQTINIAQRDAKYFACNFMQFF